MHPAAEATGVGHCTTASRVKAPASTTVKASASTAVEPATAAELLRHRGRCHRARCREGKRTNHLHISHFAAPFT